MDFENTQPNPPGKPEEPAKSSTPPLGMLGGLPPLPKEEEPSND